MLWITVTSLKRHVLWWRHQMETFSALLALCAGNSPVSGEFPAQRPVTRSFDVFFDRRQLNGWVNTREAGDLRRYRAHYDVMVMLTVLTSSWGKNRMITVSFFVAILGIVNPLRAKLFGGNMKYIYILCHSFTLTWHRWSKSFLK